MNECTKFVCTINHYAKQCVNVHVVIAWKTSLSAQTEEYYIESHCKEGAPIPQLGERRTLNCNATGLFLVRGAVLCP